VEEEENEALEAQEKKDEAKIQVNTLRRFSMKSTARAAACNVFFGHGDDSSCGEKLLFGCWKNMLTFT